MIMFSILHGIRKKSNKIDSDCISREVSDYVCSNDEIEMGVGLIRRCVVFQV